MLPISVLYTDFHKYVPKNGIAVYVVVEKNIYIAERFFDNHYRSVCL